jgi:hypothetical protein
VVPSQPPTGQPPSPAGRTLTDVTEPDPAPVPSSGASLAQRARGPWIFGALALVLVVCCGWPVYAIYTWRHDAAIEDAMKPVAAAYFDALIKGDRAAGYALICDSERRTVTEQNFSASTGTQPSVVGYQVTGAHIDSNDEGPDSHLVNLTLRYSDGTTRPIELLMVDDPAGWKVCTQSAY